MKFYLVKVPKLLKWIYFKRVWAFKNKEKTLYLTFDDGPIPEVTPWVLEQLREYNAKATFFCIGNNIEKNPSIFLQLLADGHSVGNHTYDHLNARKTPSQLYIENTHKAQMVIENLLEKNSVKIAGDKKLFRPPYGILGFHKAKLLRDQGYRIIMWDVLSADFDLSITKEKCHLNVKNNSKSGSIIIFHDSLKAEKKLKYALPKILSFYSKQGYKFKAIS